MEDRVKKVIPVLLVMYVMVNLNDSAFSLISPLFTDIFHISASVAALQVTASTIVFSICGTIYGTVTDFIPVKKIMLFSIAMYTGGSVLGLILQFNFYLFIAARSIQSIGSASVAGIYIVLVTRYLKGAVKIKYLALLTACFQFAQAVGILAGGLISTYVKWWMLFLIPLVSLVFIPTLMKNLPEEERKEKKRVDIWGLTLLALLVMGISAYFVNLKVVWVGVSAVLIGLFILYIKKNENAFVTVDFFQNKKFIAALSAEFLIYAVQIPFPFLYSFMISGIYGMNMAQVSYVMLPAYIAAAVAGSLFTDRISRKIGKYRILMMSMSFIIAALLATACLMESGVAALSLTSVLFSLGYVLMYSPMVDTVIGTLHPRQVGRGVGFNNLILNISASIGVAITGQLMQSRLLARISLPFLKDHFARAYASVMVTLALAAWAGMMIFYKNRDALFQMDA